MRVQCCSREGYLSRQVLDITTEDDSVLIRLRSGKRPAERRPYWILLQIEKRFDMHLGPALQGSFPFHLEASPVPRFGFLAGWGRGGRSRSDTVVGTVIKGEECPEMAMLAARRPWELP